MVKYVMSYCVNLEILTKGPIAGKLTVDQDYQSEFH